VTNIQLNKELLETATTKGPWIGRPTDCSVFHASNQIRRNRHCVHPS